jgi:hypothetical protein
VGIMTSSLYVSSQYSEIGLGGGLTTYWGDLNGPNFPTNITKNSGIAVQLSYRRFIANRYAIRGTFSFGKLSGDDANSSLEWQKLRNLSFYSNITEFAVLGEFYIFGFDTEPGSSVFLPYVTAGLSGFKFQPKTIYQGSELRLQPLGTEGQGLPGYDKKYFLTSLGIPVGGGAKVMVSEKINIGAEVVMRWTATDYIDDVSKNYVTYDDLLAGNGAVAANLGNRMNEFLGQAEPVILETGSIRGGKDVNDYFFISTISINVLLDKGGLIIRNKRNRVNCPTF